MYKLFVSQGVVLRKRGVGEANTLLTIFTEELGLVSTSARSARAEKSKLRYGLEPLTQGRFTFVRGKYEWKLAGVEKISRATSPRAYEARKTAGRISTLLLRLINGEEPAPALFTTLTQGLEALARAEGQEAIQSIEAVLVLQILAHLGYLPRTPELTPFIDTDLASLDLSTQVARSRALLTRAINESLEASGL